MTNASGRKLSDWIDGFVLSTEGLPTPEIFRKWAAIMTISGVLERRVWTSLARKVQFPNLYTLLVGGPAVGKTVALNEASNLWRQIKGLHLAPNGVSRASFVDALDEARRDIIIPNNTPPNISYNCLVTPIEEMGVFLSEYDNDFVSHITQLYDCGHFIERKRGMRKLIEIPRPTVTIFGCCTPSYLANTLPETAWEQGFMSRFICVYSGEVVTLADLFAQAPEGDNQTLVVDLETMFTLYGPLSWADEAADLMRAWYQKGMPPVPEHPRLTHYRGRRLIHVIKLAIISSVSSSNDLVITRSDVQRALGWLLEAETHMPDIFRAMSSGGDHRVMEDTWYFVHDWWTKRRIPVPRPILVEFVGARAPSHAVMGIIEVMTESAQLKRVIINGATGYEPGPKKAH